MRLPYVALLSAGMIEDVLAASPGYYIVIDRETNGTVVRKFEPDGSSIGVYRTPSTNPANAISIYQAMPPGIKMVYLAGFSHDEETEFIISLQSEHGIKLKHLVPAF